MDKTTERLLRAGALAGPFFTLVWFIAGLTRPGYEPLRHPISALSLGEAGWTQVVNFLVTGLLTLALAFGVWKVLELHGTARWAAALILIVAVGFLGTGVFATDPLNGYPPGTPDILLPPTLTGILHVFFAAFIFGLPLACFLLARHFEEQKERAWAAYSRASAILFLVLYSVTTAGFLQVDGLEDYAGLLQRISLTLILAWMTLLPLYLLKSSKSPA